MRRVTAALKPLFLIVVTVIVTEWAHERFERRRDLPLPSSVESLSDIAPEGGESVTENEFEHYLHVLETMQADHSLTVEPAAQRESMTLDQFRDLERRVQRNDVLVERVRETLRKKAEDLWDSRRAELAKPTQSPVGPDL